MAGYNHFDYVPSTVERKRSVFKFEKACARSAYMGWLYPVCAPVRMMPGSTLSLDLAAEIRTGALVAPLMDEIIVDFFSFFVPNRIVWEHWKQFIGAVDDVLFNNLTEYQIPHFRYGANDETASGAADENKLTDTTCALLAWNQTIACHFGLPYVDPTNNYSYNYKNKPFINALPFRGYTFIWNLNFRPEQLVAPQVISKSDLGCTGMNIDALFDAPALSWNGTNVSIPAPAINAMERDGQTGTQDTPVLGGAILPTYRVHRSLLTSSLPAPSLETLNLLAGLSAPVGAISPNTFTGSGTDAIYQWFSGDSYAEDKFYQALANNGSGVSGKAPVIADLSQALLTVNNYRETIMLQNYYDVLNRSGSRYDEIIRNIFGVQTSNAVTDIPELITHKRFTIYRKEVVAMAETLDSSDDVAKPVGSQSAYIDSVVKDSFFTKSVTEHGYIHMLYTIRPSRIRNNIGIEAEWEELDKFSLYYPQFDGMGDVLRSKREYEYNFTLTSDSQKTALGYQEYGAVWKTQRNDCAGFMDESITGSLKGFVLTDYSPYSTSLVVTEPHLLGFVSCYAEATSFSRCLALSDPRKAPQFILDIRLHGSIAHPMPVYNIPGQGACL